MFNATRWHSCQGCCNSTGQQRKRHQTNSLCISFVVGGSIKAESLSSVFAKSLNRAELVQGEKGSDWYTSLSPQLHLELFIAACTKPAMFNICVQATKRRWSGDILWSCVKNESEMSKHFPPTRYLNLPGNACVDSNACSPNQTVLLVCQ